MPRRVAFLYSLDLELALSCFFPQHAWQWPPHAICAHRSLQQGLSCRLWMIRSPARPPASSHARKPSPADPEARVHIHFQGRSRAPLKRLHSRCGVICGWLCGPFFGTHRKHHKHPEVGQGPCICAAHIWCSPRVIHSSGPSLPANICRITRAKLQMPAPSQSRSWIDFASALAAHALLAQGSGTASSEKNRRAKQGP